MANRRIKSYYDHLNVRLSINTRVDGFSVQSSPVSIKLLPNTDWRTDVSVNYRFLSISAGASPNFFSSNRDNRLKGKTNSKRMSASVNLGHFQQQISYTHTRGYYLANTSMFMPNWNSDSAFIQFPDLHFKGFYGSTAWKFNKEFSFNALVSQTEQQVLSTGTFLPSVSYHYYIIDDKTPLTTASSSQRSNNFECLLNLGYYYTLVMGSGFYGSLGASAGGGFINSQITTRRFDAAFTVSRSNPIGRAEGMAAVGYASDKFFCGAQVFLYGERYSQTKGSNITSFNSLSWQLFAGMHFTAPHALRRFVDGVEQRKNNFIRRRNHSNE